MSGLVVGGDGVKKKKKKKKKNHSPKKILPLNSGETGLSTSFP